jgi:hypothetical protein
MAFKTAVPQSDAGARLTEHFCRAGLPNPKLFCQTPVGNGDDPDLIASAVSTFYRFTQQLVKIRVGHIENSWQTLTVETVAVRESRWPAPTAIMQANRQIEWWPQVCWTRT